MLEHPAESTERYRSARLGSIFSLLLKPTRSVPRPASGEGPQVKGQVGGGATGVT